MEKMLDDVRREDRGEASPPKTENGFDMNIRRAHTDTIAEVKERLSVDSKERQECQKSALKQTHKQSRWNVSQYFSTHSHTERGRSCLRELEAPHGSQFNSVWQRQAEPGVSVRAVYIPVLGGACSTGDARSLHPGHAYRISTMKLNPNCVAGLCVGCSV